MITLILLEIHPFCTIISNRANPADNQEGFYPRFRGDEFTPAKAGATDCKWVPY